MSTITIEELAARIKILEQNQKDFALREVFNIFRDDLSITKQIVEANKATRMKLIGALVLFEIFITPLLLVVLKTWT